MKKIWPIVLLGILLLCISCVKEEVAETDLIFEGKTYVIGSGKPPKGQPMKMLIRLKDVQHGVVVYNTVDSFYTDHSGYFKYRFSPNFEAEKYLLTPESVNKYDNLDFYIPRRGGVHKCNFRIVAYGVLRLRLKNGNYMPGDSILIIDAHSYPTLFIGPLSLDYTIDFQYPSFEQLRFQFALRREGLSRSWSEDYYLYDDSVHLHEIIF